MSIPPANQKFPPDEDALLEKASWEPIRATAFREHDVRLVKARPGRIEFQTALTLRFKLFGLVLAGLAGLIFFGLMSDDEPGEIFPLLICSLLALAGLVFSYAFSQPVAFDRQANSFTEPKTAMVGKWLRARCAASCALDEIHALQILNRVVEHEESEDYSTYELNLILHNGERLPVTSSGRLFILRREAEELGRFLNVAVWDKAGMASK